MIENGHNHNDVQQYSESAGKYAPALAFSFICDHALAAPMRDFVYVHVGIVSSPDPIIAAEGRYLLYKRPLSCPSVRLSRETSLSPRCQANEVPFNKQ